MNNRRNFLNPFTYFGRSSQIEALRPEGENINFGLCTYMWGAEWDVPTLISNLKQLSIKGVELRVEHAHKVSPELSADDRSEIHDAFENGEITVIGMGTNVDFDSPDPAKVKESIALAKKFVRLSHDIGGSGVKVKPNNSHEKEGVPLDKTLEQIGKALAEVGDFAIGFGQEIRLEVHGTIGKSLGNIAKIMEVANSDTVRVCWNSNPTDVDGGLEHNFDLVKKYLGHTTHIHELDNTKYPYAELFKLFVNADYDGWMLMEAATKVEDKVMALGNQKILWTKMMETARARA